MFDPNGRGYGFRAGHGRLRWVGHTHDFRANRGFTIKGSRPDHYLACANTVSVIHGCSQARCPFAGTGPTPGNGYFHACFQPCRRTTGFAANPNPANRYRFSRAGPRANPRSGFVRTDGNRQVLSQPKIPPPDRPCPTKRWPGGPLRHRTKGDHPHVFRPAGCGRVFDLLGYHRPGE